ncbi:MAG: PDZ domain-containing protein [Synergistaceae bacterium]|jgi:type II secretory pathway component PulC|nr:PDZ domain-containing protein [Synergistaceae bacterium]
MLYRIDAAAKLKDVFQRLRDAGIAKGGRKWPVAGSVARFAFGAYPCLIAMGLVMAYLFCSAVSGVIASRLTGEQIALAAALSRRQPSPFASEEAARPQDAEIKFAAFGVADLNPASADKEEAVEAKPIDSFSLVGTLPRIGAWISVEGATSLVLRAQEFNGYVLESVSRGDVVFTRDGESFPLFLNLSGTRIASAQAPQTPQPPQPPRAGGPAPGSSIASAEFNGNEGTLTRELLDDIIANPMQILQTIRLVPEPQGMRVARVRSDNLLAQLGIKQGDLLTGINGIPINNGTDMLNVMKSLLQGNRFDLQTMRGQENGMLRYSVR